MSVFDRTRRNKVLRKPQRGHYEKVEVYAIVDEALYCHVAFVKDGQPFIIPTLHARDGDTLLLHGSSASRMIRHAGDNPLCVSMPLIDGIVLARSGFHHSVNYRSAVLFGRGEPVDDPEQKMDALARFTERLVPGRWGDIRLPDQRELKATGVIAMPIESASAKIRTGPPVDDEKDMDLSIWAGVLPFRQSFDAPVPDPAARTEIPIPGYLQQYLDTRLRGGTVADPINGASERT